MAPPNKRRRLADSVSQPTPSFSHSSVSGPSPTLSHTVEQLDHRPSLALIPQPSPQRINDVRLQVQRRAGPEHHDHHHAAMQRRQLGTAVSSLLDSTLTVTVLEWADALGGTALSTINDDLGGTYGTTQTLTLVSSPLPTDTSSPSSTSASTTPASTTSVSTTSASDISAQSSGSAPSSAPSEGFIDSSPSGTGVSSTNPAPSASGISASTSAAAGTGPSVSGAGSPTSISAPSAAGVAAASASGSAVSSSNSTRTDTTRSSSGLSVSSTGSRASLGPGIFLATLSNGDVATITRSDQPYTTTFADGRVSTISPIPSSQSSDDDDSSNPTSTTTRTMNVFSDDERSTQQPQTRTSVNFVNGPTETGQAPATPTQGSVSSTSSAAAGGGGGGTDGDTPPAGTIAGGVVGGCAGIAVILLIALVLLRWWKRKAQDGHRALPPSTEYTPDPEISSSLRGQPGMAERAGLRPLVGAVPAFFRHANRSNQVSAPPSERGFQRVSGRKLPSQFSAGMTSSSPPPPDMPLAAPGARSPGPEEHERNLSATSFYRDSHGFYGGEGVGAAAASAPRGGPFADGAHSPSPSESLEEPGRPGPEDFGGAGGGMTLSPGPRRTPTVHRGGPYTMASPSSTVPSTPAMPLSPAAPSSGVGSPLMGGWHGQQGGGYPRSETPTSSVPDERSSRFTEEV